MLVFDDGLGGFLPLSQADLPCDPLSFAAAGIAPSPASLMVMADGVCVVKQTRRALYRHWQLAEGEAPAVRGLLARAARITTEITLGRGDAGHLAALDDLALELTTQGLAAAWPLGSSLRHFRAQWEQHVRRESCPEGAVPGPAEPHRTLPQHLPGQHRHPQLHGPPGPWRLPRHDRGHPPRQPAAADLRPGLPGAVRIGLRARQQRRRRVHPAAEGHGRRALPGQRRLPAARDRARHRQAHRHRRLRPGGADRRLLPAHPRPPGRDLRDAGTRRRHAALRHPGLPAAARAARAGTRADQGAGHPDPHRRQDRPAGGLPQELRRRLRRPGHADRAPAADRRRAPPLRARRHRLPARRAQRRAGARGAARGRRSAAATSPSTWR